MGRTAKISLQVDGFGGVLNRFALKKRISLESFQLAGRGKEDIQKIMNSGGRLRNLKIKMSWVAFKLTESSST